MDGFDGRGSSTASVGFDAASLESGAVVSVTIGLEVPRDRLARLPALVEALLDGLDAPEH